MHILTATACNPNNSSLKNHKTSSKSQILSQNNIKGLTSFIDTYFWSLFISPILKHHQLPESMPLGEYASVSAKVKTLELRFINSREGVGSLHSNALLPQAQKRRESRLGKNGNCVETRIRILLWSNASKDSRMRVLQSEQIMDFPQIFLEQGGSMGKYTKVYMRNKKQSNISLPLRFSLLRSIFVQNMSVKEAAAKWRVHYSSAKIIARTARRNKLYFMFDRDSTASAPAIQCSYKEVAPEDRAHFRSLEVKINEEDRESDNSSGDNATHFSHVQPNKIEVHSTIGWTYMALGGAKL